MMTVKKFPKIATRLNLSNIGHNQADNCNTRICSSRNLQRNANVSASWLQYVYFSKFSKPSTERRLYATIKQTQPRNIVEIGVGTAERAAKIIAVAQRFATGEFSIVAPLSRRATQTILKVCVTRRNNTSQRGYDGKLARAVAARKAIRYNRQRFRRLKS